MKKSRTTNGRKTRRKGPPPKPYWEMTTAELREATKEFDREFIGESFGPPTPEQQARFERARKRGRPCKGLGAKTISVTIEKRLLAQTDRLAKKLHVPRAVLIARGLRAVVSEEVPVG
ncbi:MAG: hypothetical protein KKE86_16430 [Planctomycetes bacterium]|nr:hypothetical protein [Planctomycetota bacterium]MBU4400903.1 hypothetical protein [Planctomycetota bacterium]MCG2684782.1 hypothetical protein [Planctomycetales bacterium]